MLRKSGSARGRVLTKRNAASGDENEQTSTVIERLTKTVIGSIPVGRTRNLFFHVAFIILTGRLADRFNIRLNFSELILIPAWEEIIFEK